MTGGPWFENGVNGLSPFTSEVLLPVARWLFGASESLIAPGNQPCEVRIHAQSMAAATDGIRRTANLQDKSLDFEGKFVSSTALFSPGLILPGCGALRGRIKSGHVGARATGPDFCFFSRCGPRRMSGLTAQRINQVAAASQVPYRRPPAHALVLENDPVRAWPRGFLRQPVRGSESWRELRAARELQPA